MRRFLFSLSLLLTMPSLVFAANDNSKIISDSACQADPTQAACKGNIFASGGLVQTVAQTLVFLIGAISVLMLIIGGLRYVLSGGDPAATKGAKDTILYAVIGVIVALTGYALVHFLIFRIQSP